MKLQFLRPEWFLILLPIMILSFYVYKRRLVNRDWAAVIDAPLLPHLLTSSGGRNRRWWFWLALFLSLLVVIALAGPVWNKLPQPVFKKQSALVIGLDLSQSMNAQDIKPSRLARARLKLIDILKMRNEGQTALLAYAATPYTVSPLTDDSDTIQSLVSSLTSDIMPAQGSRADLALEKAQALLKNAGITHGDILLITDGISEKSAQAIRGMDLNNIRVSILSVGSDQGAPIPNESGGFLKDEAGSIVIVKTPSQRLRQLASDLGGLYLKMQLDDGDIQSLQSLLNVSALSSEQKQTDFRADQWQEEGPWLLLLVLPLAALAFRRGMFLSIFLLLLILPAPHEVFADDAWDWQTLWLNQDQLAAQKMNQGLNEQAAELFSEPGWKAAAHYKAGQYEDALEQLQGQHTPDATYNRANTLAKLGRLQESLEAYDEVLKQQPDNEDASYNRKLVEEALKKQQQQQGQSQDGEGQQDQGDQQNQQDQQDQQDQQSSEQSSQQSQDQSQQQSDSDQSLSQSEQQSLQDQGQSEQDEAQSKDDQADEPKNDQQSESQQSVVEQQINSQDEEATTSQPSDPAEQQQTLSEQAEAQWLRRIPDDPGGLLRNKFKYQYGRQSQPSKETEQW